MEKFFFHTHALAQFCVLLKKTNYSVTLYHIICLCPDFLRVLFCIDGAWRTPPFSLRECAPFRFCTALFAFLEKLLCFAWLQRKCIIIVAITVFFD